jgi:hypothetical protein
MTMELVEHDGATRPMTIEIDPQQENDCDYSAG